MRFSTVSVALFAIAAQAAPASNSNANSNSNTNSNVYACAVQPAGIALRPATDTAAAFVSYSGFSNAATTATAPPQYLTSFVNSNSAVVQTTDFMTYYLLSSYSPQLCADYCTNTYGCQSFNIFFERAPSVNPAAACPNPPSDTYVKCSLFSQTIASTQLATNSGQWRGPYTGAQLNQNFQVVIAGSNTYNKK